MLAVCILLQPLHQTLVLVFAEGYVVAELLLGCLKASLSVDLEHFRTGVVEFSVLTVEINEWRYTQVVSPVVFSKI